MGWSIKRGGFKKRYGLQKDWFNIPILTLSQNAKFVKRQENLVKWLSQYAKYKTENRLLEFLRGIGNRINYFEEIEAPINAGAAANPTMDMVEPEDEFMDL